MTRYLDMLRKGWVWIVALVVLGGCVGYGLSLATAKVYRGTSQLFVILPTPSNSDLITSADQNEMAVVRSLPALATSPQVTMSAIVRTHLHITSSELADKITADEPDGKMLINVHVSDHDPRTAALLTNAVSARFAELVGTMFQRSRPGQPRFELSVVHPATVPSAPISPDRQLYTELGLLAGLVLGLVAVSLRAARPATPDRALEPALAA